jgi:SAM-dependent methyltransferase
VSLPVLVCPVCRHFEAGALHVRTLAPTGGLLTCACGAAFPLVDGIPIVHRDLDAWLAGEGAEALRRADLPPEVDARILAGTGGAVARNAALLAVYRASREGPLQDWLRERCAALSGSVLELGSGVGVTGRADGVALDHNLGLLRAHPGARVCGDAADPPFLPASFDAIVCANLLDSCADPGLVLAQADALLRPGGTLVVTCAYAFQDTITPRARRFTPAELAAALDGRAPFLGYTLEHRLVHQEDGLRWPLHISERLVHEHAVHGLITEKAG